MSEAQGSSHETRVHTTFPPAGPAETKSEIGGGVGGAGTCPGLATTPALLSLESGDPGLAWPGLLLVARARARGGGEGGWPALLPHSGTGTHAPGSRPLHTLLWATLGYCGLMQATQGYSRILETFFLNRLL